MFVAEGHKDRWRMVQPAHAQSTDETGLTLPSHVREDMYSGGSVTQRLLPVQADIDQLTTQKNEE